MYELRYVLYWKQTPIVVTKHTYSSMETICIYEYCMTVLYGMQLLQLNNIVDDGL
jgi:hypothetical protein